MNIRSIAIAASALFLLLTSFAAGAAPARVSYQGRLTDAVGLPLNGNYSLTFRIYDQSVGGIQVWSETQNVVNVSNGFFTVMLGSATPLTEAVFNSASRYVGIQVGADPELAPRQQIVSVAYALTSVESDSTTWSGIKGIPADFADGIDNVGGVGDITAVTTSGGLTGGATTGDANISIANSGVTAAHIGDGQILNADINATANIDASKIGGTAATLGRSNVFASANQFNSTLEVCDSTIRMDCNGISIGRNLTPSASYLVQSRRNFASDLTRYGVFTSLYNSGAGSVYGSYSSAVASTLGDTGAGTVYGSYSLGESDNSVRYGSYSTCSARNAALTSGDSYGHYASGYDGANAYGVYGYAASANFGCGLRGETENNSGSGFGVFAISSNNFSGTGVKAFVTGSTNVAIGADGNAQENDADGIGVYGTSNLNGGTGYGVYGWAASNIEDNWAGYFSGDVNITGSVFMPAKMTRIDHPLDPENKYLVHNTVESSEMTNLYSGNVMLDADGAAVVVLPDWFEAANKDFRYQITCIGGYAPVYIAEKITGNRFRIAGGNAGLEVSWQIMAVRNDQYAKANPMSAVTEKRPHERGKYRFPETFGLGKDRAIDKIDPLSDIEARNAELEQLSKNKPTRPAEDEINEE